MRPRGGGVVAGIDEVLERLVTDLAFRRQLEEDPRSALEGYVLYDEDLEVLAATLDEGEVAERGVERRTSKSAFLGAFLGLGGGTSVGSSDDLAAPTEPPEGYLEIEMKPVYISSYQTGGSGTSVGSSDDLAAPTEPTDTSEGYRKEDIEIHSYSWGVANDDDQMAPTAPSSGPADAEPGRGPAGSEGAPADVPDEPGEPAGRREIDRESEPDRPDDGGTWDTTDDPDGTLETTDDGPGVGREPEGTPGDAFPDLAQPTAPPPEDEVFDTAMPPSDLAAPPEVEEGSAEYVKEYVKMPTSPAPAEPAPDVAGEAVDTASPEEPVEGVPSRSDDPVSPEEEATARRSIPPEDPGR
jgi:hypothetical protein